MTIPRLIRIDDIPSTPWANGRGQTVELARHPASGAFAWRLSMATITAAAPFSSLAGVERALMPMDGPLTLTVDGRPHRLTRHETVVFSGDADVSVADPGDAQRDLNLMVRDGGRPTLTPATVEGRLATPPGTVAAVVVEGDLTALGYRLRPGDAIVAGDGSAALRGSGTVVLAGVH